MTLTCRPLVSLVFIAVLFILSGDAQAGESPPPMEMTLCDLATEPEKYAGTLVKFSATVTGRREFALNDFAERPPCPIHIMVLLVFPNDVKPAPEFDLEKDDSFRKLQAALLDSVSINATFEGRFDSAFALIDGNRIRIEKGYGKDRLAGGRLVLRKVSDVKIHHIPRR